jgi:group I intron endonuclease
MIIYKITNLVNQKIYIGLTTCSLRERWLGHIHCVKSDQRHLYCSMRKYGIDNFKIEQIDETDDYQELGRLEAYYIEKFNSRNPDVGYNLCTGGLTNSLDDNGRARLRVSDVIQIREVYYMKELRCRECWEMYKDKISFSAFQKIWEGSTWKSIMPEVYTPEMKALHSKQKQNPGQLNGNALFTDEEVLEIRKFYANHSLQETYEKFGGKNKTKEGFRSLIASSYKHIPIYSKIKKKWTLKGQEIDINSYNPVSTISGSGE